MDLKEIITRIDSLKKQIDEHRPLKPEQERRLMQKLQLDWNFHSNKIEGNSLTYGETKALVFHGITAQGKPLIDHIQMKGHEEAIEYILDIIKGKERPISEVFIRDIHTLILDKKAYQIDVETPDGKLAKKRVHPGKYKELPNHVKTKEGKMFLFAEPEDVPVKMSDLISWFRDNNNKQHPLITAAVFHYKFILIHPFDDGNGRVARILMNFIFMMHGLPPAIIRTERKDDYYTALAYADSGELNKFTEYIGEQEIASLELMLKAARGEMIEEPEDIDKKIYELNRKIE